MATEQEIKEFDEIVKHNRELAKIDGYREVAGWDGYDYGYFLHPTINVNGKADISLDYHSNWNSLIRIIKAFRELTVSSNDLLRWKVYIAAIGSALIDTYNKQDVYARLIEALKWYQSTQHEIQSTPGDEAI